MEQIDVFGKWKHLVGVSNYPENRTIRETAIIMLTPGMLHHVGPMGLHVQLARHLADEGFASFRFDLSGIGESFGVGQAGSSLQRATNEIGEAMDLLNRKFGFERFALFGLCSGADDALAAAPQDPRIRSLTLLDGCAYSNWKSRIHKFRRKYWPKLFRLAKWVELVRNRMSIGNALNTLPDGDDIREFPSRDQCEMQIQSLLSRGTHLHFVYTGGAIDDYGYAEQFFDMFPSLKSSQHLLVDYFPEMDHLVCLKHDRAKLFDKLVHFWLQVDGAFVASELQQVFAQPKDVEFSGNASISLSV